MMHLSRFRSQRNALAGRMVTAKAVKDFSFVHEFSSSVGFSSGSAVIGRDDRSNKFYPTHTIFKGKAALSLSPISPKFGQADNGIYVKKPGAVLLIFWPAIGTKKYDWQRRQAISLSPTEVGSLISLGSGESCEICHDISKIESMSSQAVKRFAVQPLTDDNRIFHLSVIDNIQKINDRFSVPVTKAEFAVIRTACSYVLPHMIGWDMIGSHGNRMLTSPSRSHGL
ncbi:single-stranded DNA-binding protein WHY2, mitochondrial isoform X2 [Nymphaea colorata]|uniref:single-stranded DNA-binding protein WHY2, mitochondrial isoform X2 n=1 Tax=Nymphaea colorata TaxID=210225 RepID=UPI00129E723B|nr:single-stranded DNA-binding protein WHY2, mitochondrial isoform X2 [Nymphaea colorata]